MSARHEISTVAGQELLKVNKVLRQYTDYIRSGVKQFSAHAEALEFSLKLLTVIITVTIFLAIFSDR